ncbi:YibE/F family protein [Staphylococcus sp. NRL 16/872]|uniref:YibE/F family protein n=1 Tax=Staphylococcus sp. NRL 16/872 TaxID=2930131 RepID=UPI001FB219EA|nr:MULTISPECIES: YibE/F family protein [unclassified Staphylococcus]MCJ1657165.1 YibE/F family protein [Staphylococcus sp. NRL 21/187]MCJ1669030.1 YibE/F family protein [Staphylococcus sp. NRL 19/737]WEN69249.1 YibE/F family protein [Staphylococcus sp. NRL 16/872]
MNLKNQTQLQRRVLNWITLIIAVIMIALFVFTFFNASFYHTPIGKITQVDTTKAQKITDEHHNSDLKYKQHLTLTILNGQYKGTTTTVENTYAKSQADTEHFNKNDKVLLHIQKSPKDATILEKKRDSLTVAIVGIFIITLLLVGRHVGLQSILSLIFNTIAIMSAIAIHNQLPSTNLFLLMSVAVILSTIVTLLLVTGWHLRTWITALSTLLGTFLCIGITEMVIQFTGGAGIKYETMSFLTLPPKDVFMASVLIGSLGAVMDVAITISSGMYEIVQRTPDIATSRLALAGRNIGQDIMGTMTNILLFSYLSGSLSMFLIYLKNANTFTYTISMNWSLEIARALTGGIGIVLTIPITIGLMVLLVKRKGVKTR